jgi:hypothetical protein
LTCGCSIQTTAVPIRDWSSGLRSCTNWEYRTRSSTPLQNLIRRDSFYSTTCRIRRSKRAVTPTKPQPKLNSGQLQNTQTHKNKKNQRLEVPHGK